MASTEKLPSGKHRGVYYDAAGKKRHTPAVDRKRDAYAAARDAESLAKRKAAAHAGTLPGHTTYGEWQPVWWDDRDIEPTTAVTEAWIFENLIMPEWAEEEMARIAQPDVQGWVNRLGKLGHAPSYVQRVYAPFRASMSAAVRKGVLTASPCVDIKIKGSKAKPPARIYTDDELERIHQRLSRRNKFVFAFIEETGLRPAEFCGLHRHRIDRKAGWLTVAEVYDRAVGEIKAYPKDVESRQVPLTSRALELLDEWDKIAPPVRKTCGLNHRTGRCHGDVLYRQHNGKVCHPDNLRGLWRRAQARAEVADPGSPYDLRHQLATRLAEASVDPWTIAYILGHATLEQSGNYIHRTATSRQRILAALGDPAVPGLTALPGGRAETPETAAAPTAVPRLLG